MEKEIYEQINQATNNYIKLRKACRVEKDDVFDEIDLAFWEGANFGVRLAEQNTRKKCDSAYRIGLRHSAPQWHKIDKFDPLQPEECEPYLCYDGFSYFVAHMKNDEWFSDNEGNKERPIAWCKFQRAPGDKNFPMF